MTAHVDAHKDLHSEQGAPARRAPGTLPQSGHQGARPGVAGVREARPGPRRSLRAERSASPPSCTPPTNCTCAEPIPGRRAWSSGAGPRSRFVGPAFAAQDDTDVETAGRRDGRENHAAARRARRRGREPDRSERRSGPRRGRHPRAAPSCRVRAAHVQLRARRCGAPTPRNGRRVSRPACSGWGMSCCRAPSTSRR